MRYSILFSILILFLASCTKNKFNTIPSLTFKSVNTSVLVNHQTIVFSLSFTDAEGDLSDSLYVEKKVLNCSNGSFKTKYPLPAFPTTKNQEGVIDVTFGYNVFTNPPPVDIGSPQCQKNDTVIFKFVLKDKAQHKSDTAFSGKVVIVR